jgi:hypothetical protein
MASGANRFDLPERHAARYAPRLGFVAHRRGNAAFLARHDGLPFELWVERLLAGREKSVCV